MTRVKPGTDDYRRHRAILLILGFLDGSVPRKGLDEARGLIDETGSRRKRAPVKAVLEGLGSDGELTPTALVLLDLYAGALMRESKYAPAGHLFRFIAEALPAFGAPGDSARVYMQWGRCLRKLGNTQAALLACQAGLFAARIDGDPLSRIELLLELAAVYLQDKRAGEAEKTLSEAHRAADAAENHALAARAAHDLGVLTTEMFLKTGEPLQLISAARLLNRAWHMAPDDETDRRLRILNDLGRVAAAGHFYTHALAAYRIVYDRARERDVRWRASINMLDVLHRIGGPHSRQQFDAIRWELDRAPIPAPLKVTALVHVVEGLLSFDPEADIQHLCDRARRIAKRIACVTVLEDVEALEQRRIPPRRTVPEDIASELGAIVERALAQPVGPKRLRRGRRPNRDHG